MVMTLILAPVSAWKSGARRCNGSAICGPVNVSTFTVTPANWLLPPPLAAGAVVLVAAGAAGAVVLVAAGAAGAVVSVGALAGAVVFVGALAAAVVLVGAATGVFVAVSVPHPANSRENTVKAAMKLNSLVLIALLL